MKEMLTILKWDLILLTKYKIVGVAIAITVLYIALLKFLPSISDSFIILLIFSDPIMFGFMFIGVLILFEKDANTLQALVTTPIKWWQYVWSKTISLTVLAVICSFGIVIAGKGFEVNFFLFSINVILSSFLFILIGFVGVAQVKTFNQYIIIIPMVLAPAILPFLNFFQITDTLWFYIVPTQATLLLFEASLGKQIETWQMIYSISILLLSVIIAHFAARKAYFKSFYK